MAEGLETTCLAMQPAICNLQNVKPFTSRRQLEAWLKGKHPACSPAIALRIALRIFPLVGILSRYQSDSSRRDQTAAILRCNALSWAAGSMPTHGDAARTAKAAADAADAVDATGAASEAARAVGAAFAAGSNFEADAAVYAGGAASNGARGIRHGDLWNAISIDCRHLDSGPHGEFEQIASLRALPLWGSDRPSWFDAEWHIARTTLGQSHDGFGIWVDWFQRRIDGNAIGFDLPLGRDTEINHRLISAPNDWWERPPVEVNADIKAWLHELSPPLEPDEADFNQNVRALTFSADADGRIGLAADLAANRLLDDADAQDRHAELLREAKALHAASQHGETQATDLDQPARHFIEAIGESLATTKPSWLVARGEKLRRMRKQRQDGTSLAPPFSERQAEAIDALITALDIMVGLDPYLHSIRQASYDPDLPKGSGDPVKIRLVIDHALAIKVARADAHGALADALENVPADAAPDDRRRLTLWADFKNFIQATGRFIWKHKGKIGTGVASAIALIQLNAAALKDIFAASPTMLEIIRWIEMIKLPG